jgi:putative ABC transport system substrate-binding protein
VDRRCFLLTSLAGVLAGPLAAQAQSVGRVYRVACLWAVPPEVGAPYRVALEQRLRELGWIEGHNIVFEHRFPASPADLPALAEEVVKAGVDIIIAATNRAIAPAARATSTIPIVMMWGSDPIGSGFALSMARPGKNVTGLTSETSHELFSKHMELVKQLVPNADRVLVIMNAEVTQTVRAILLSVEAAARTLGMHLELSAVRGAADIERAFDHVGRARASAVYTVADGLTFTYAPLISKLAMQQRLPSVFFFREAVDAGGLASYGPNFKTVPRDAATFVDKILRGAKPADLPVEQPTKFELIINLKTAKALGLTIPPSLLVRADQVIE